MRILGLDEAGRGCVLGPLVVGGFVCDATDVSALEQAGVDDSKALSKKKREALREVLPSLGKLHLREVTPQAIDAANHVHARGYAPLVGVPEDPFTGSMQGGLAAYLVANDMVDADLSLIGSEQGHFIDRPGQVGIEIVEREPQFKARLHASAVAVFETELSL